ncbi:hypothetical protein [Oceanobacillus oncorhynchi]|uniref:hypothetical protein n=1 Tax=Oceanobacillus oncorhynchi TaxID=545501 RepID=UPI0034D464A9
MTNTSINNKDLINKVYELWNKQTLNREDAIQTSTHCSIIRRAFKVKEKEIVKYPQNYVRRQVMSNNEITSLYKEYIRLWGHSNRSIYFIEAVSFFNESLANELKEVV